MEQNIIEPFLKKMLNARLEYVENNPDFVIRVESNTEERSKRRRQTPAARAREAISATNKELA